MIITEDRRQYVASLKKDAYKLLLRRVKKKILDHNLSHEKVAWILGVARSTVTMWLTEDNDLSLMDGLLLIEFFNISVPAIIPAGDN